MRIVQCKFKKVNPPKFRKKNEEGGIKPFCRVKPPKRQISVESHGGWGSLSKKCCKCKNTYRFIHPYLHMHIQKLFYCIFLYEIVLFYMSQDCLDPKNIKMTTFVHSI